MRNKNDNNLQIRIHGIANGKHFIELSSDVESIPYIFPEFFGEVSVNGFLTKIQNRFNFNGTAKCNAKLICDISLEEYIEEISVEISVNFVSNTALFYLQKQTDGVPSECEDIAVHEDSEYFDLTTEIKDSLIVNIPMQRISPNYKDKKLEECFPQLIANRKDENEIDSRWEALKNITLNN